MPETKFTAMMNVLVPFMLPTMVPHAMFCGNEAKGLFRHYLPALVTNRIINREFNGHLSKVISLLKQDDTFMICSVHGSNAFVCTDHGSTHIVKFAIVEKGVDALTDMTEWHKSNFPDVDLQLV